MVLAMADLVSAALGGSGENDFAISAVNLKADEWYGDETTMLSFATTCGASVNGCDAGRERFTTCRSFGDLVVRGKLMEVEKEMEVPRGRPALFDNQANLCLMSCCSRGSMTNSKELPGGKKDTRDQTLMHRG